MASTTKYRIAEQCLRLLNGGDYTVASKFHINEVKLAVEQSANRALKMEYLNTDVPFGQMIPSGAAIASYENIPVVKYKNVSKSTLPAFPIKLPRNLGIHEVYDPRDVTALFIPMEPGQLSLLKSQPLINDLLGQNAYTPYGMDIVYNRDLTIPNTNVYVSMRLIVLDISQYGDWDILPIPSDMEMLIINDVCKLFAAEPIRDTLVDANTKEQRNVPVKEQSQA